MSSKKQTDAAHFLNRGQMAASFVNLALRCKKVKYLRENQKGC